MSLLNRVIGTGIANPMVLAKETGFNLVMFTEVAEGHGSAMSIGSLDSSKCEGTPVLDSGPRHGTMGKGVGCWPAVIGTAGHQVG